MKPIDLTPPDILFRKSTQEYIFNELIAPKVEEFLKYREIDFKDAIKVEGRVSINDLNFPFVNMGYFYNTLLKDFAGSKKPANAIFYTITHDKKLVSMSCIKTRLEFNQMYLGKKPFFYFIYLDLQDIFDFVRSYVDDNINFYKSRKYKTKGFNQNLTPF